MFFSSQSSDSQFILVEYSNEAEARKAIADSTFPDADEICASSPFLWFRAAPNRNAGKGSNKANGKLLVTDGCRPINYNEVNSVVAGAENLANQMTILHKMTTLNDLGVRMRFLAARQIEDSMAGVFPDVRAHIFGSTVNGYGRMGSDLDMVVTLNSTESKVRTARHGHCVE